MAQPSDRPASAGRESTPPLSDGLEPWTPDPGWAPAPDRHAEPDGFLIASDDVKLHFLDWGGPPHVDGPGNGGPAAETPGILLLPGLMQPAWSWAPVARRLRRLRRTVVTDLRGQGLSDSPPGGYDLDTLAEDAIAVAEASGLTDGGGERQVVVVGHGFGGIVAAAAAARLGARCAAAVLVDGGWERLETTTGVDVDEFLRGFDEPPEVMRSMDAWLGDRRSFDPASWDGDQERAAREAVVETAAGRVVRTVRPFVVEALARTMFAYEPTAALAVLAAPVTALVALGGGGGAARLEALDLVSGERARAGLLPAIRVVTFPSAAHNLMRYRPAEVAAAILGSAA
jgi:pimeloyl-ACP methyl ester carboxylesterase